MHLCCITNARIASTGTADIDPTVIFTTDSTCMASVF